MAAEINPIAALMRTNDVVLSDSIFYVLVSRGFYFIGYGYQGLLCVLKAQT